MKPEQLKEIRQWFAGYVQTFANHDGHGSSYQLKIEHSQRVAQEMRRLAQAINGLMVDVNMAEAIGWLHDIGRFSQFQEFGTFHDAQSINHGERGRQILKQLEILSALSPDEQHCMFDAVQYHNTKTLPAHLENPSLPWVKLIRDADKLDIFHIVHESLVRDGFQDLPKMLPQVKLDGPINPIIINQINHDHTCSINEVKSLTDFLLLQLSWVYDINYVPTFQQIAHRHIVTNLSEHLPLNDSAINNLLQEAKHYVGQRASHTKIVLEGN